MIACVFDAASRPPSSRFHSKTFGAYGQRNHGPQSFPREGMSGFFIVFPCFFYRCFSSLLQSDVHANEIEGTTYTMIDFHFPSAGIALGTILAGILVCFMLYCLWSRCCGTSQPCLGCCETCCPSQPPPLATPSTTSPSVSIPMQQFFPPQLHQQAASMPGSMMALPAPSDVQVAPSPSLPVAPVDPSPSAPIGQGVAVLQQPQGFRDQMAHYLLANYPHLFPLANRQMGGANG